MQFLKLLLFTSGKDRLCRAAEHFIFGRITEVDITWTGQSVLGKKENERKSLFSGRNIVWEIIGACHGYHPHALALEA